MKIAFHLPTKREALARLRKLEWLMRRIGEPRVQKITGLNTFDMRDWKCGTSACAAGWAASYPWFKSRGLYIGSHGDLRVEGYSEWAMSHIEQHSTDLADFFGISSTDENALFYDNTEEQLQKAGQIARVIRKKELALK